jgi:F0F1-type ATP synthase assembly protein I
MGITTETAHKSEKEKKMRNHFMFHTLVFFMAVLTFSVPFGTLAQQNPVQTEAIAGVAQEANVVHLAAKAAAEKDANNDVNKSSSGHVAGYAVAGCIVGALVGCAVGSLFPDNSAYSSMTWTIPDGMVAGTLIGGVIGLIVSSALASSFPSNPQPKRLLGKSPEYVESYANAYKVKVLSLRAK